MAAGNDRPGGDADVYAPIDEAAYLQTNDDKPAIIARPPPDPAQCNGWFCRKSHQRVRRLFGAEYPVRDPNNFANETLIFICNECVAKFAQWVAPERPEAAP